MQNTIHPWFAAEFFAGAFVVLAFLAAAVMRQRDIARRSLAHDREHLAKARQEEIQLRSQLATARNGNSDTLLRLQVEWEAQLAKAKILEGQIVAATHEKEEAIAKATQLASARNVTWTRPPRRMPANEVKRAFAIDETAPLWIALNQEIDDWLQGLFDEVSKSPSPTLTEANRLHVAGGIEEIRELQKRLLELQAAAQTIDADLESDAPKKGGAL